MSAYKKARADLGDLLKTVKKEIGYFESSAQEQRKALDKDLERNKKLREGVEQMAKERQIGFPWLAKAYDELFHLEESRTVKRLRTKLRPAPKAADKVREQSRLRREAQKRLKVAQYLVEYYENIAPFLIDLKEEVDIATDEERGVLEDYSEEERRDETTRYLTKEEYRKLPSVERNQMALDRFWKRQKSKWLIGRMYERYVGYLYEEKGYDVEYVGIFKGYEDLGRDLICRKGHEIIVIQCKNWSKFRTIYEKHIFQFFGTVFQYRDENPEEDVQAIFYTSTALSDLARRFSRELGIELQENSKLDMDYPCIKCNVSRADGTRIYHLPFDQQYDRTKIEKHRGEFYCSTVKEAEDSGFRRAFRYRPNRKEKAQ